MWAAKFGINKAVTSAAFPPLSSCDGRQNGQACCWNASQASKNNMPQCKK